jgi:FimV-like protein
VEDALPEPELPVTKASIEQQFKLVDAFIDMGDKHSARELLAEMMSGDDDEAAAKAGKMLTRLMG